MLPWKGKILESSLTWVSFFLSDFWHGFRGLHGFSWCFFVVAVRIQALEFSLRTILRRGEDFSLYSDPFAKIEQEAHFDADGFEIVDQLGFVGRMQVFGMGDALGLMIYYQSNNSECVPTRAGLSSKSDIV